MKNKQRKLDFRIWDGENFLYSEESMGVVLTGNGRLMLPFLLNGYDFDCDIEPIFQLFTGLKDKKRVKVFEGDIVKAIYNESYVQPEDFDIHIFEVKLNLETNLDSRKWYGDGDNFQKYTDIEVIGNIFQHKHLLKS